MQSSATHTCYSSGLFAEIHSGERSISSWWEVRDSLAIGSAILFDGMRTTDSCVLIRFACLCVCVRLLNMKTVQSHFNEYHRTCRMKWHKYVWCVCVLVCLLPNIILHTRRTPSIVSGWHASSGGIATISSDQQPSQSHKRRVSFRRIAHTLTCDATQLYTKPACEAHALAAKSLYSYWPRRRYSQPTMLPCRAVR